MREDPPRFGPAGPDPCGAEALAHLLGKPAPDAEALEELDTPGRIRVIAPGQPVTMDYIETRLNIELDENGLVALLRCG